MPKPLEGCDIDIGSAIGSSPDMAQIHLWRAQYLRDRGCLSGRELTAIEAATGLLAPRARLLWNPFTNEFRTAEIDRHYRSGAYIEQNGDDARLIGG